LVDQRILRVLKLLCEEFCKAGIDWVLAGSLSLALQGVDVEPEDIDVLTDREGAFKINSILKKYEEKKVEYVETDKLASFFGIFRIDDVEVEVMGDYKEREGDKWVSLSHRLKSQKIVKIDGYRIPVSPLEDQLRSYKRSDRLKDYEKVRKILQKTKVEYLDVVDENNRVIGRETREKIHSSGLWHRGVHVIVFDSKNRLILQMRSAEKDKFPNRYDLSVSEHLAEGETYKSAAVRGLREELGITSVALKRLMRFKMNYGPNDNMISELYKCRYDGSTQIDKRETKSLEAFSLSEIKEMLGKDEDKFALWTKEILKWYLKLPSKVQVLSIS